jgi:hypothetical protein
MAPMIVGFGGCNIETEGKVSVNQGVIEVSSEKDLKDVKALINEAKSKDKLTRIVLKHQETEVFDSLTQGGQVADQIKLFARDIEDVALQV